MTSSPPSLPSARLDPAVVGRGQDEVVSILRELIRIPSTNPPNPPGGELAAAEHIAGVLTDCGVRPEVVEPFPGRGSVTARLRGDGTGGEPLLLLSHLDVVPAPGGDWTHDPFGGDLADGYVWGRGAVDMKDMVALELGVIRLLTAEARAGRPRPGERPDPRPAPGRPVRLHRRRGGGRARGDRLDRRSSSGVAAGRRRAQRMRRRRHDDRRSDALPHRRRREGVCRVSDRDPGHVGAWLDAPSRQRGRPRVGGHRQAGGPGARPA